MAIGVFDISKRQTDNKLIYRYFLKILISKRQFWKILILMIRRFWKILIAMNIVLIWHIEHHRHSARTFRRARDTLFTGNDFVSADRREEGAGERKNRS